MLVVDDNNNCCHNKNNHNILKNKAIITGLIIIILIISGYYFSFLEPLKINLINYLSKIGLPILIGLFLGGIIEWAIPQEYISRIFSIRKKRTIIYSVMAGFLMSACSHGILAIAIQLYKKGAPAPSVAAFLLASPWANLPITILLLGLFGLKGLLIIISAIIIAIISGLIFIGLEKKGLIEINPNALNVDENFSIIRDAKIRIKNIEVNGRFIFNSLFQILKGSISLANMVLWWIFIGIIISSLIGAYFPTRWMEMYMGASIAGLFVTLGIATIMEICSEGTAPLAFEIYRQTGAFGNSFVFLMAGVATDYTEIGLLWTNIGRKTAIFLPVVVVPQVIIFGLIFNLL